MTPSPVSIMWVVSILVLCLHASAQSLTVTTSNGLISGHLAPDTSNVIEYLGIPYAEAPTGDLRFAPPKRYSGKTPYEASNFGNDCPFTSSPPVHYPGFTPQAPRVIKYFAGGAGNPQSEDCLTLNIWTKSVPKKQSASKPVLVFLYGGRFSAGDTDSPFYNGKYFVESQDVVVVTLNYRTNIFGFPGAPGIVQNAGLRDQRMAVEWVRDNIKAFGGDHKRITLFGQSSGSASVDYYSYAYKNDPIVSGLISHSGNAFSFPLNSPSTTTKNWYNVSDALGCGAHGDTLECMRQKNWTDIKAAAAKIPALIGGSVVRSVPGFYPTPDNDTVFSDYDCLAKEGAFAQVPYLLGNNNYEQGFYNIAAYGHGINVTKEQGDDFLLSSFTCPNKFEAEARKSFDVPVWQFRYFGDWDNIRLYNGSGAYHGTDLEMIFGNSLGVSGIPPSAAEVQTTELMQRYWAAFAHNPHHGLAKLGWPEYDPSKKTLNLLAYNNNPHPRFVRPSEYDAPCSTVELGAEQTPA